MTSPQDSRLRNVKRILFVSSLAVFAALLVYLALPHLRYMRLKLEYAQLHSQLMENPEPLPTHLIRVVPFPGAACSRDDCYHESPSGIRDIVCIGLDARSVSRATDPYRARGDIEVFNRVDLYLNDELIDDKTATGLDEVSLKYLEEQGKVPGTQSSTSLIGYRDIPPIIRPDAIPITSCWQWVLSPGDYVAEVVFYTLDSGTLSYQWAFIVK
jgi:hypothetical protein